MYQPTQTDNSRNCGECGAEIVPREVAYVDDVTLLAYGITDILCVPCYRLYQIEAIAHPMTESMRVARIESARKAIVARNQKRRAYGATVVH